MLNLPENDTAKNLTRTCLLSFSSNLLVHRVDNGTNQVTLKGYLEIKRTYFVNIIISLKFKH